MSKAVADSVGAYLAGNLQAQRAIAAVREGVSDPDYLNAEVRIAFASGPDRLRGFMRTLQKQIEGGARNV